MFSFSLVHKLLQYGGFAAVGSYALPHHSLTLPPHKYMERKHYEKRLTAWDKDRNITHQLPSQISQTQHREINVIYYLLLTEWSTEKLKANSKHLSSIHSLLLHVVQGNEDCSQSMILYLLHGHCLPLLHMGSLPQSAILSQLIHVNIDMCTINICQVCGKLGKLWLS